MVDLGSLCTFICGFFRPRTVHACVSNYGHDSCGSRRANRGRQYSAGGVETVDERCRRALHDGVGACDTRPAAVGAHGIAGVHCWREADRRALAT